MLKEDSLLLELADLLVDVVDIERQRGGLVGAGEFRTIDVDVRVAARERGCLAVSFILGLEA